MKAFNVASIEQSGFEADDLIATYARLGAAAGADVTIVSSDKDLMQLVTPTVTMFDTMKDKRIGPAEVVEKFGVLPDKVIEVQALIGDTTDNVPGVPGIGVKTAAQLIADFGDLESLLSRTAEIKQPKRREALETHAENARLSKKLVTLDANMTLDVPIENLAVQERDGPRLVAFCKIMEFVALGRRVAEATKTDMDAVAPGFPDEAPQAAPAKKDKADVTEEAGTGPPGLPPVFQRRREACAGRRWRHRPDQGCRGRAPRSRSQNRSTTSPTRP